MRTSIYGYKRKNHSFKIADWPACQRIHTSPNLKKISHGWANASLDALSSPALKILRFLAALNLTGKTGYAGFAVAYELLSPLIGETTSSGFARRSMERGIHDLKQAGLVDVHPWLQEGQFFRVGGRNIKMTGALKITLAGGGEVVRRLAIVQLTPLALSMWEAGKGNPPAENGARKGQALPSPGTANLAVRSPETEQIDKSIMLGFDSDPVLKSESVNVLEIEGRSTRPTPPQTAPPAIEHEASTKPRPPKQSPNPATVSAAASSKASVLPPTPVKKRAKGCSKQRPNSRGPSDRGFSSIARDMILSGIWDMLANHSTRQADASYARAVFEIDQLDEPGRSPTASTVDWAYWLDRWEKLSPPERRIKILREILPLLKSRAICPHDKRKVLPARVSGTVSMPGRPMPPSCSGSEINPFFEGVARRMGIDIPGLD